MAFGSPGGNFYEILEPLDQTVHDFRLRAPIARERWQLQVGYALSIFHNDLERDVRQPLLGLRAPAPPAGCGARRRPRHGRRRWPPTTSPTPSPSRAAVTLPWWRTRLSPSFTYSLRFQNQDFLPHTINRHRIDPALALPRRASTASSSPAVNVNVSSRPLPPLTLS